MFPNAHYLPGSKQELSSTSGVRPKTGLTAQPLISALFHQEVPPVTMNAIGWFEIYVKDMPRAKRFYEGVFGKKLEKLGDPGPGVSEMWSFPGKPDHSGATGALVKMENGPAGIGGVIIYFVCEDCAVESARVAKHDGKIVKEKFSIGQYGHIALATDTAFRQAVSGRP
jgi:hypothetical protein